MALKNAEVEILKKLATDNGLPVEFVLGIIDKESAGRVLWRVGNQNLPAIRIEGHYFFKELSGAQRDRAVREGLAASKAGAIKNPAQYEARYAMLEKMADINSNAAYRSISIGIGQIMGTWHTRLGYSNAYTMWLEASKGLIPQAEQMIRFIKTDAKLYASAKNKDYPTFARIYNGPKHNNYDVGLRKFVETWEKRLGGQNAPQPVDDTLDRIKALGYDNVRDFQKATNLKVDGIIGPLTRNAVLVMESRVKQEQTGLRDSALKVGATTATGAVGIASAASSGLDLDTVQRYTDFARSFVGMEAMTLVYILGGVAAIAGGVALYEWVKNRKQIPEEPTG